MNMQPALDWVDVGSRRLLNNHGNFATEGSPKSRLCPILFEWLQGFFIVHSTIDSTVHDGPLNSIEQQADQMSHRSRSPSFKGWYIFKIVLFTQVHLYTRIVSCTFLSDQCVFGLSRRRGGGGSSLQLFREQGEIRQWDVLNRNLQQFNYACYQTVICIWSPAQGSSRDRIYYNRRGKSIIQPLTMPQKQYFTYIQIFYTWRLYLTGTFPWICFKNKIISMANVFNLSPWSLTSVLFHSLKIDNCDSYYSRLVVHEDFRLKRVNLIFFCSIYFLILRHRSVFLLLCVDIVPTWIYLR